MIIGDKMRARRASLALNACHYQAQPSLFRRWRTRAGRVTRLFTTTTRYRAFHNAHDSATALMLAAMPSGSMRIRDEANAQYGAMRPEARR